MLRKMADERKFSVEPFSFEPEYSSDNHSESSSDEVQSGEDTSNRLSTTNWCQCAKCSTSTLKKEIECVCCRQIENVAVLSGNFEHLNCITDHFDFEAVCLNETVLRTVLIRLKHSSQGKCDFKNLQRVLANE